MSHYIQNPDGTFAGSVGQGRDAIPTSRSPLSHTIDKQVQTPQPLSHVVHTLKKQPNDAIPTDVCDECVYYQDGFISSWRCCRNCNHCVPHCICVVTTVDAICEVCGSYMGHGRLGYPWSCFVCTSTDGSIKPHPAA